jgi:aldose 1-epimerase
MMKRQMAILALAALSACGGGTGNADNQPAPASAADSNLTAKGPSPQTFADTIDGKPTHLYSLHNGNVNALITDYGARLVSLFVPDKAGRETDVVAGFDSLAGYRAAKGSYFGAIIGRYGNRIAKGKFSLDGKPYAIPVNNGPNALHGGTRGFDDHVWDAFRKNDSTLVLYYLSPDGDQGFPGNLKVMVTYTLRSDTSIGIEYQATSDRKTIINLTNHAYFNLNGAGSGTILNHALRLNAQKYTPVDSGLIPTGAIAPVAGTPFDFTEAKTIGSRIGADDAQLKNGKGYDHNFVIGNGKPSESLRQAAMVTGDKTGIVMHVLTTEPGIQFYTGNFMSGAHPMKYGKRDDYRTAFCLETQHFPDSPNEPKWPSTVLDTGKTYHTITVYHFSTVTND